MSAKDIGSVASLGYNPKLAAQIKAEQLPSYRGLLNQIAQARG